MLKSHTLVPDVTYRDILYELRPARDPAGAPVPGLFNAWIILNNPEGIKLLANTEGIITETAGGVTVGVTKKLIEQGIIPRDESILISITGNGLKTQEAIQDRVGRPLIIDARLSDFEKIGAPKQGEKETRIQVTL